MERAAADTIGCKGQRNSLFSAFVDWCLVFERPLSKIVLDLDTCCTLKGMITWQNLNSFLVPSLQSTYGETDECAMGAGCVSSIIHEGISCRLGELQAGTVKARLTLAYEPEHRFHDVFRDIVWHSLPDRDIFSWLTKKQEKIWNGLCKDSKALSLASFFKGTGMFQGNGLKYRAALAAARGLSLHEVPTIHVYELLAREAVDRKEYLRYGSKAKISLYNSQGELVCAENMDVGH